MRNDMTDPMEQPHDIITYQPSQSPASGQQGVFRLRRMPEVFLEEGFRSVHLHTHSFYTIIWFLQGQGYHYVDFDRYEVVDDTIFFISPGQMHTFDAQHTQLGYVLEFSEEFLQDEHSGESLFLKYDVFNAYDTKPFRIIDHATSALLHRMVKEIERESRNEHLFAHHNCLAMLVCLFLIQVQRSQQDASGQTSTSSTITSPQHRTFVKFRQLLERDYRRVHTVSEYARMLGVSQKTLTQYTTEAARQTPLSLINARLTLEAKRLLRFSTMNIKEIGYDLGFEDPSYFNKFFKRQTGLLPGTFRAEQQQSVR